MIGALSSMWKLNLLSLASIALGLHVLVASASLQQMMIKNIVSGWNALPSTLPILELAPDRGEYPWHVLIKKDEYDSVLCGGSIIHPQWVLTAAHCCEKSSSLLLRFGTLELDNFNDKNMTVSEIFIHPQYHTKGNENDICLIKLPEKLQFSAAIQSIPLLPKSEASRSFVGELAYISGFGTSSDEYLDVSEELLWARIKIIENSECSKDFTAGVIVDSMMCGKGYDVYNMSICSGDSGGALVAKDLNGHWVQIGINNFVPLDECAVGKSQGYARISSFLNYIYQVTGLQ